MNKDELRKKHEERMAEALAELEAQAQQRDPSAEPQIHRADIGRGTFAHSEVPSTSTKIVYHDRIWESVRNRHPQLESGEVEALLEHVYGQSVYSAAPHFESFDRGRFDQAMNMSEEQLDLLLYGDEEDDE